VEAVGLLIIGVAPNLLTVIIGGLVVGAGLSLLFPALALLVINRTDKAHQGAALGTFTSFWDIGLAAGGPLAGAIASGFGYPAIYWVMLVCAVASAGISSVDTFRREPSPAL
jgi:MFS family permease